MVASNRHNDSAAAVEGLEDDLMIVTMMEMVHLQD